MRDQERLNPQYFHICHCTIWRPYLIPRSRHFAKVSPWFPSFLENGCGSQPSLVVVSKRYVVLGSQIASKVFFQSVFFYAPFIFHEGHFKSCYLICYIIASIFCFYFMFCFSLCVEARVGHDWATELNWTELMWDLSSPTRGWSHTAGIGRWRLNHGTTRGVLPISFYKWGQLHWSEMEHSVAVVWRPGQRVLVQETWTPCLPRISHKSLHSKICSEKLLGVNDRQAHRPIEQMHCRTHGKRTNQSLWGGHSPWAT